ncbi:MAG TPA: hypothetical protein EYO09_00380 [Candidatus Poseidoniales archaeon]|nr:hypothetical protein [Candidatus Poseidoniales archaeon]
MAQENGEMSLDRWFLRQDVIDQLLAQGGVGLRRDELAPGIIHSSSLRVETHLMQPHHMPTTSSNWRISTKPNISP